MRMRSVATALAAVLVGAAVAGAAPRILLRTGELGADGFGLDGLTQPAPAPSGAILFRGTSSALVAERSGGLEVLVRTGDALPAPLVGTFDRIGAGAANDAGDVVFAASLNSAAGAGGIFRHRDGSISPMLVSPVVSLTDPYLNDHLDLVSRTASTILLLPAGAEARRELVGSRDDAPGGGTFRRVGAPVLNDSAIAAFVGLVGTRARDTGGVFVWEAATGLTSIARTGDESPIAGVPYGRFDRRQAVAINAHGDVAFVAELSGAPRSAVVLFERARGAARVVARAGDMVGGEPIDGFYDRFVGVDSRGTVAFAADTASGRKLVLATGASQRVVSALDGAGDFAPRLTDDGAIAWLRDGRVERYEPGTAGPVLAPDTNTLFPGFVANGPSLGGGSVVFNVSREGIYAFDRSGARLVATVGQVPPGFGPIASIDGYALWGPSPVLRVSDVDGNTALLVEHRGALSKLLATGDAGPSGTVVFLDDGPVVAGRSLVLTASSSGADGSAGVRALLRLRRKRSRLVGETLAQEGATVAPGVVLMRFAEYAVDRRRVALLADLDDALLQSGLFLLDGRRLLRIVVSGDATPDGETFTGFATPVVAGRQVLFAAFTSGEPPRPAVFAWRRGRLRRLFTDGDVAAGGTVVTAAPLAVLGGRPVLTGTLQTDQATRQGLFVLRHDALEPLFLDGDTTRDGTAITLAEAFVASRDEVAFVAQLTGAAPAQAALVAVTPSVLKRAGSRASSPVPATRPARLPSRRRAW